MAQVPLAEGRLNVSNIKVVGHDKEPYVIQVAAKTQAKDLALSISAEVKKAMDRGETPNISLHAIGPQAVNIAVKGIIIANTHLATSGLFLGMLPSFKDTAMPVEEGQEAEVRTVTRNQILCCRFGG